ncbi:integrase catalytic domain-containing protein [Trichonephila clavata]|uniref:Integrase catalytic domain-containing protein n=1 Tax=Trichonephila clavata TaxID=2740835 RepID=A0A8X6KK01_TRICU|nr:integrase catalytic domain-containing protein [Trichonephila clavata]
MEAIDKVRAKRKVVPSASTKSVNEVKSFLETFDSQNKTHEEQLFEYLLNLEAKQIELQPLIRNQPAVNSKGANESNVKTNNHALSLKLPKLVIGNQVIAPLPDVRVTEPPPFSVVGFDFAGPLFVKDSDAKQYTLLITCAVTRSVHLELVDNVTTDTFLLAFRRFIARRGLCSMVISENTRTFNVLNWSFEKCRINSLFDEIYFSLKFIH